MVQAMGGKPQAQGASRQRGPPQCFTNRAAAARRGRTRRGVLCALAPAIRLLALRRQPCLGLLRTPQLVALGVLAVLHGACPTGGEGARAVW